MAIVEKPLGGQAVDERARIAIVSVIPETGEVIWDEFDGKYSVRIGADKQTRPFDQSWKPA
jgi:hypothetical protein